MRGSVPGRPSEGGGMAEGGGVAVEGGRVEGGAEVEAGAGWESVIMEGESESESESEDSVEERGLTFGSASRRSCSLRRRFPMTGEGGGGARDENETSE